MTFAQLMEKVLAIFPEATLDEDIDGQIVISTNLREDWSGNIVQFEEEPF